MGEAVPTRWDRLAVFHSTPMPDEESMRSRPTDLRNGFARRAGSRLLLTAWLGAAAWAGAAESRPWQIYLLFGQSNMAGGGAIEAQDKVVHPRVKVLAYDNCSGLGRTFNQWYPATPPMHECYNGVGPADMFSRVVADSFPQDTIGLVPCAISGVNLDFFVKGVVSSRRGEFRIPPDNKATGAYTYMVERLKIAKQKGTVRGILFHQGEADWSSADRAVWVDKVKGIVDSLKKDVGFGDVPFLAGELRQDGCCGAHNTLVAQLPSRIANAHVISSKGLSTVSDSYHFNTAGYREFGRRYAAPMIAELRKTTALEPRVGVSAGSFRLLRAGRRSVLAFAVPQERVVVTDPVGTVVAQGSGNSLELPEGSCILFFQSVAQDGARTAGMLPLVR